MFNNPDINHVVLFDGYCNLCNGFAGFVKRYDKRKIFQPEASQSQRGQLMLESMGLKDTRPDSVMYLKDNCLYTESDAAIEILRDLGGLWKIAVILLIIPANLRNKLYAKIARNRYQLFGKKESCVLTTY